METSSRKSMSDRKQQRSKSTHKMDCGPKYSKVSESLRYVTSGSMQCSMFCGGRQCKYEGQAKWNDNEMIIKGLYSSWATDSILAMARPSTRIIKKFNVIAQFQRWGIGAVINLQHPGEHANCGFGLEKSGFTYNPEDFMDNGIFFFNFIWKDYGVRSLESVLDIVKVMDFALQDGKVAVHCHAGLGRTGVLIACYLIYSLRITPEQAIHTVRIKRPRSVQTRGQISCVQDFAKFLKPLWVIFPLCSTFVVKSFTLQKYLVRQKHVLHGYEARELKIIPKIIFVPCKRLLQLCGLDASKLRLTNDRVIGKPDDEIDATDGMDELDCSMNDRNESACDISASLEDLKGEFDTENISSNESCDGLQLSNSHSSGSLKFENEAHYLESSRRRKSDPALYTGHEFDVENNKELRREGSVCNKDELISEISRPTEQHNNFHDDNSLSRSKVKENITVNDVATAFSTNTEEDNDVMDEVQRLQKLVNESNEGWKMVEEERNPYVLTTLMTSWIHCLMEPVLNSQDVKRLVENNENTQQALLCLTKAQRGIFECLLVTIFKLNSIDEELREKALLKILTVLTRNCREVTRDDDCNATNQNRSLLSVTEGLSSTLMAEFLKYCVLLYENWLKEVS